MGYHHKCEMSPIFIGLKVYLRPNFFRLAFYWDFLGLCIYYIFIDPLFFYIIFLVILDNLLSIIYFHVMRI